jgi:hypothetical protein
MDFQGLGKNISNILRIAIQTYTFYMTLVAFILALGITGGIVGSLIDNALLITIGIAVMTTTSIIIFSMIAIANRFPKSEFQILRKYVTYRILDDRKSMVHTKDYHLLCLKDNQKSFTDRYKWSCENGRVVVESLGKHQRLEQLSSQEWSLNRVVFDPPLTKRKETDVSLRWNLFCEGRSNPFLSQIVDNPTRVLVLSVFLPYDIDKFEFVEFKSGDSLLVDAASVVMRSSELTDKCQYFRSTREIRYRIDNPTVGHKYMITWEEPSTN